MHGFGGVDSSRNTGGGFGFAAAHYGARIDGALTELDYYWTKDQSRIVPKLGLEYVRASTGAFQEIGGLDPLTVSGSTMERTRVLAGAEVGHYWILDHQRIVDISAYGKFVDNVSQQFSSILVSLGPQSITVTGIGESQYGADAGASASLSISNTARLYLNYDGKFRSNLTSHQGTLGFELRFVTARLSTVSRSTLITRPRSIASASRPCFSASAASPNSSRRQPCRAATSALSSAAICSRSSTVAITLLATAWRSEVMRSSTFSSSTIAAPLELLRGFSILGSVGRIARQAALHGGDDVGAPFRALEAFRQRAQIGEPLQRGRCVGGDVADRIVLQHAAARHVAALRFLLAPGRDLHQHREFLRLAHPRLQPLPGALGMEVVGAAARSGPPSPR